MLCVIPFCDKDFNQAVKLLGWMLELDGRQEKHECLLVGSAEMANNKLDSVLAAARLAFEKVTLIKPSKPDMRGWPFSCNTLFRTAQKFIFTKMPQPFWWNEPDCIPVKRGWLDDLAADYELGGKPFMGAIFNRPFPHLPGCAVYPADVGRYNPECLKDDRLAWDVIEPQKTLAHVHETELLQHEWGNIKNNIAPTFPTVRSLDLLNPKAVVFHRNKDGTLIDRLREKPSDWKRSLIFKSSDNGFQDFDDKKRDKKHIKNVTLVAIDGRVHCGDTLNAIIRASSQSAFDECLFFSPSKPWNFPPWIKHIRVNPMSLEGYNRFCLVELIKYIRTSHCLTVQADSGINNADAWTDGFLMWDYIGSPWPEGWMWSKDKSNCVRVGNSGFCLRSVKLLRATARLTNISKIRFQGEDINRCVDDVVTCLNQRHLLEQQGIKIAPLDVATKFAFELPTKECPKLNGQFGFHLRKP